MNKNNFNNSEGNTSIEFISNMIEYFSYFKKNWLFISLFIIFFGISGFIYAFLQNVNYTAKITFILEESNGSSSGLGGLASLAGQFGVDVGGSSEGGLLSGDNILLYFKSPSLAREVLLSRYNKSSQSSIADEYVKAYELTKKWSKNKKIGNIQFPIFNSNIKYTRLQDSLILEIIQTINTKQFNVARTDKKADFIDVTTTMQNELLAKIYCERIVQKVVDRYIGIKTQRQNATVNKLEVRADSIANLLKQKTFSGASLQNNSSTMDINPLYKTGTSVAVETTLRDKSLLSTIFASVTQNLELAKFTLSQETPVIQVVDAPILPLKQVKLSRLKSAVIGALLGVFFLLFGIIFKRIYNNIKSSQI